MGLETRQPRLDPRHKILIVDDDPQVLAFVSEMVKLAGYDVVTAPGPEAAIAAFDLIDGQVDLVVSDFQMPGMNGEEMVQRLRHRKPALPVIIMTGYSAAVSRVHTVLEKPFAMKQLHSLLAEMLQQNIEVASRGRPAQLNL